VAELSPAAQAVLHSFWDAPVSPARNCQIAAALRAAADQANPRLHIEDIDYQHQSYVDGWNDSLDLICAIATELEQSK
jgi:phage baseplate assembly protein W